ncbi:MAG: tetratricopeptide repeat protein [Burkholderiaceae bacterium]
MPMLIDDAKACLIAGKYRVAFEILMEMAMDDSQPAIMLLSDMCIKGQLAEDHLTQLQDHLNRKASRGWGAVQFNLGVIYERGINAEKDLERSKRYYRQAADQLVPQAHVNLAYIYLNQDPKDVEKALEHLEEAIELGSTAACNTMGLLYMKGEHVEKNTTKAFGYLFAGAREKGEEAKKNLFLLQTLYPMNDFAEGKDLASEIVIRMANARDRYSID